MCVVPPVMPSPLQVCVTSPVDSSNAGRCQHRAAPIEDAIDPSAS